MMNLQKFVLIGIILLAYVGITVCALKMISEEQVYVISGKNGKRYLVRNTNYKSDTADILAQLDEMIILFLKRGSSPQDEQYTQDLFNRMRSRTRNLVLSEGIMDPKFTTYVVNKGQQMVFCLRSRDGLEDAYDLNLLFYVALHELAHIGSLTHSIKEHDAEFHKNFNILLTKAISLGMFKEVLPPNGINYCGEHIRRFR